MNGIFRKGTALVKASVFLAIAATGGPAAGTDGIGYPEERTGPSTHCGSPADGATLRAGEAGHPLPADPAVRGMESSRREGEEPRADDAPCSIETIRKRAARTRIS